MNHDRQLCTFTLSGLTFAVDARQVREVLGDQKMTPVPLAAPVVRGLINLRGQIITAFDLRRRLHFPVDRPGMPMNVVLQHGDEPISLLVDDIGEILDVPDAAFESAPETIRPGIRQFLIGVYKLESTLILLLDTRTLLHFEGAVDE